MAVARRRSIVTLVLCTGLHAFTHIFGSMLVPLYLLMVADLHLSGARLAALVVTIYGLVYNLNSYPAGVLADHVNRKWLLTIGLLGNALAIGAMGLSRHYPELVVLGILAGLFGSLFHPTANALVPSHFPENPGLAIGLLGIGSGVGFFLGPQVAGWRAQSATWHFANVADWQRPCIELAIAGIIFAMIFFLFARETRTKSSRHPTNADSRMSRVIPGPARGEEGPALPINEKNSLPISPENVAVLPARLSTEEIVLAYEPHTPGTHLPRPLFYRVLGIASVLGMRDFAGVAAMTLASIYLQKAFGYSPKQAGLAVGLMMLLSILVSPTSVYLTGGKRRLPMLAVVLITGGAVLATVPLWGGLGGVITFCVFQTFQLGSYAMSDASMLERVAPEVRGRVVGVFLTFAGTFGATAPFVIAAWTDLLHDRASQPHAYTPIFLTLAAMMAMASFSTRLIGRLAQ